MTYLKKIRNEIASGNFSLAENILQKMIDEDYPKSIIKSLQIECQKVRSKKPVILDVAANICNVLIISSPGDKMTNYYRSDFLHEILQGRLGYKSRLSNTAEVTKEMIKSSDVIYISRGGVTKDLMHDLEYAKDHGKKIIFDADDYVFDENIIKSIRHIAINPKRLSDMQKHARRLASIGNLSDIVLTSTYFLAKCADEKFGKSTFIIPNVIKNNVLKNADFLTNKRKSRKTKHTRIGYFSGTKSHDEDFKEIANVLYDLMQSRTDIEFLVCGELNVDIFKDFGSRFIKIPLQSYEKMHEYLATIHVNLAPLEVGNIFVHGKSELKIFDAAIYEIPTLASRTDSYNSIVIDGFNGYLCDDRQGWYSKISYLLDNADEIQRLGINAKNTLVQRFLPDIVSLEYMQLLESLRMNTYRKYSVSLNAPTFVRDKGNFFSISLVTILYKKEKELPYFLESLRRQKFEYPFELIVVDDCSPDDSLRLLLDFQSKYINLPGSNKNLKINIIKLDSNLGNCLARNIGIDAASADVVSVVDADCVLNRNFLQAHYDAHASNNCDVAIGPKGIETNGKHPLHVLSMVDMSEDFSLLNASPQDVHNQASFINTVTRNLSFRKSKVNALIGVDFFDKNFSYSRDPNSGFGWEDVEFGIRLHKAGAKFIFLNKSASIHISHDATENVGDKAFRSLKNFDRLILKHPDVKVISHIWYVKTLDAIENWCLKTNKTRYENEAQEVIKNLRLDETLTRECRKVSTSSSKLKKIKVITSRWHCPHQYELYKLGCEFYLLEGFKHPFFNEWEYRKRPLPYNAKFISLKDFKLSDYDLAIIHFDENVLRPDLCNGKVPAEWGDAFQFLSSLDIPKIYLCHGTPQFHGQYNSSYSEGLLGLEIAETKNELINYIGDEYVVCNSEQAKFEWGFKNSGVIYHGFSASEFSYFDPMNDSRFIDKKLKVLSLPINALSARPLYNGMNLYNDIYDSVDRQHIEIENLSVSDPTVNYQSDMSLWAQAKYRLYGAELLKYNCYLNTTKRSPMPRTRAEAMFSGAIAITTPDHDMGKFIIDGQNGFIVNNADDAVNSFNLILDDLALRRRIATASYETAANFFSQERYLSAWVDLIFSKIK